jgi:hypothetical protein
MVPTVDRLRPRIPTCLLVRALFPLPLLRSPPAIFIYERSSCAAELFGFRDNRGHHHSRSVRRPSLTLPPQNIVTVPLRARCPDCIYTTEECLKEGELWEEKSSRGTCRRSTANLDVFSPSCFHGDPSAHCSALTAGGNLGRTFPLASTVDEVEQKRKSTEFLDGIPPEILSSNLDDCNGHGRDGSSYSAASCFSDEVKPFVTTTHRGRGRRPVLPASFSLPFNSPKRSVPFRAQMSPQLHFGLPLCLVPSSHDSLSGSASDKSVGNTRQNWRRTNRLAYSQILT